MRNEKGQFVKGNSGNKETQFKNGQNVGEKHPQWKGGITRHNGGYVYLSLYNHPNCDRNGRILEHRLVMEKKIGRYLTKQEVVHHINGIKDDNRVENLVLCKNNSENRAYDRKFEYYKDFPKEVILNKKIVIMKEKRNRFFIGKECDFCNNLFWKSDHADRGNCCSRYCGSKLSWRKRNVNS
jgi:hypothetical protein